MSRFSSHCFLFAPAACPSVLVFLPLSLSPPHSSFPFSATCFSFPSFPPSWSLLLPIILNDIFFFPKLNVTIQWSFKTPNVNFYKRYSEFFYISFSLLKSYKQTNHFPFYSSNFLGDFFPPRESVILNKKKKFFPTCFQIP